MRGRPLLTLLFLFSLHAALVPHARAESLLDWFLRVTGISSTPGKQKGPPKLKEGRVWLYDLQTKQLRPLTPSDSRDYRSPVFGADSNTVIVLKDRQIVLLTPADGKVIPLGSVEGIVRLIGVSRENPQHLHFVGEDASQKSYIGTYYLDLKHLSTERRYPQDKPEKDLLIYLKSSRRVYTEPEREIQLDVKSQSTTKDGEATKWQGLVLIEKTKQDEKQTILSTGDGIDSDQPSLSPDHRWVVFLRSG